MKPHVTVFSDAGQPFIAMHIGGYLRGLWTGAMFQCAGEVLKELVNSDLASLSVIGGPGQKAWDEIKSARDVLAQLR